MFNETSRISPFRNQLLAALAVASCACLAVPARAADNVPLANLKTCAAIENSGERLACYDRLARGAPTGPDGAGGPALTEAEVFGMRGQLVRKSDAEAPAERAKLKSISAHVTALASAADGSLVIVLDNGQTWRQEDSLPLLLKTGDEVTISRGALASFRLSTPAHRTGRVIRVR
jgi:hypothetical protein